MSRIGKLKSKQPGVISQTEVSNLHSAEDTLPPLETTEISDVDKRAIYSSNIDDIETTSPVNYICGMMNMMQFGMEIPKVANGMLYGITFQRDDLLLSFRCGVGFKSSFELSPNSTDVILYSFPDVNPLLDYFIEKGDDVDILNLSNRLNKEITNCHPTSWEIAIFGQDSRVLSNFYDEIKKRHPNSSNVFKMEKLIQMTFVPNVSSAGDLRVSFQDICNILMRQPN